MLAAAGLVHVDEDMCAEYVVIFGRRCRIEDTPSAQQPANIMGLKVLMQLGLRLSEEVGREVEFTHPLPYLSAEPIS